MQREEAKMKDKGPILGLIAALIVGVALLGALHQVMRPAPLTAVPVLLLGLVALWLGGHEVQIRALMAVGAGALVGGLIHLYAHRSGGSPQPQEGLATHLVTEVVLGTAVGVVLLLAVGLVAQLLAKKGYWRPW
jgi:hypothetical protein